eukprot:1175480-Prorocentrum_minimum.AAC.1
MPTMKESHNPRRRAKQEALSKANTKDQHHWQCYITMGCGASKEEKATDGPARGISLFFIEGIEA